MATSTKTRFSKQALADELHRRHENKESEWLALAGKWK